MARVLLLSTYEMGRQPFGLASPAAWLRDAGCDVGALDLSRQPLDPDAVRAADLVALYLPMHTATRLAGPVIARVRELNPRARLCAYGLYAPLNESHLRALGVSDDSRRGVRRGARRARDSTRITQRQRRQRALPRLAFRVPDRRMLPPLTRYARLHVGTRRCADGRIHGGDARLQASVPALSDRADLRRAVPRRPRRRGDRGRAPAGRGRRVSRDVWRSRLLQRAASRDGDRRAARGGVSGCHLRRDDQDRAPAETSRAAAAAARDGMSVRHQRGGSGGRWDSREAGEGAHARGLRRGGRAVPRGRADAGADVRGVHAVDDDRRLRARCWRRCASWT